MISDITIWINNPGRDIYAKLNKLGAFYLHLWTYCPFRSPPLNVSAVFYRLSGFIHALGGDTRSVHRAVLFLRHRPPFAPHLSTTQITEHATATWAYFWHQLFQVQYYAMRLFFSLPPWQGIQAHWFTSSKVFSCSPSRRVFLFGFCCCYEWLSGTRISGMEAHR